MSVVVPTPAQESPNRSVKTVADLVRDLGDIPLERIRLIPAPGTATDDDLIYENDVVKGIRCELIDGTVVEKAPMAHLDDSIATVLAFHLRMYLRQSRLGEGFTAGAMYTLLRGNIRLPDFTVCLNSKFPTGRVERVPYADFAPDLAVEVLSVSNTRAEIARKRGELFAAGTSLMRVVDPEKRTVKVYTAPETKTVLTENDTLNGGDLLPGFALSIKEWFREAEEV